MRWKGETSDQRWSRLTEWHKSFCILPKKASNGTWIWLEQCWRRAYPTVTGGHEFEFSDSLTKPDGVQPYKVPSKK